jgi:stage II sporulation protein D
VRSPPRAAYLCAALLSRAAAGEEIRIELWHGHPAASVESAVLPGGGLRATAHDGKFQISHSEIAPPVSFEPPVRLDGRLLSGTLTLWADGEEISAVEYVDLEEYVASVVSAEVPSAWPKAALEAQAVAARTFAMAQKVAQGPLSRSHLRASVLDQVYAQGGATPAAKEATRATRGEVLTFGEAPIAAYFSASCGGRSEGAEEAFHLPAGATPYLASAREDDGDPERAWTARIPLGDISAALRKAGRILAPVSALSVAARTPSGRAREIVVGTSGGTRRIGAGELRQILGYEALPSLLFTINLEKGAAVFRGRGSGHGVGLCQWGARGRALRGSGYRAILAHYYPGAQIRRMY